MAEFPSLLEETSLESPEDSKLEVQSHTPSTTLPTPSTSPSDKSEDNLQNLNIAEQSEDAQTHLEDSTTEEPQTQVRKSQRTHKPPGEWWKTKSGETASSSVPRYYLQDRNPPSQHDEWSAHLATVQEPSTYTEAMKSSEKEHWIKAIQEELDSLERNKVWDIVPLPKERKLVGCHWVFQIKTDAQGNLTYYKARLVAKGYSQVKGIDYEELFAPVTRYETL